MPPAPFLCNKCKVGLAAEGDSWCIGCSSLELSQNLLKGRWQNQGIRRTAEEVLVSGARLVKAFSQLDKTIFVDPQGRQPTPVTTAAKKQAAKPDRSRSPQARGSRPDAGHREDLAADEYEYSEDFGEEGEEECVKEKPVKREQKEGGHRKPPEPDHPPPRHHQDKSGHHHKRDKPREKKTRRGGTRRQKHHRERDDPFRRSHRTLRGDTVELAGSFQAGLDRRV